MIRFTKKQTYIMKKLLLNTFAIILLAFASNGQQRFSGIPKQSIKDATYQPSTQIFEVVKQKVQSHIIEPTSMVKALCIDTLLFEDFQSQSIPGTWINLDSDGLTDANGRPSNWFPFADLQTTTPGDTNYVAASSSWFSPAGTANNVLILDAVGPCPSTILKWSSAPFEGPTYMDGYEVRISTTGTNITDFTTVLFTVAESVNGTTTPSTGTPHTNYNGNNGVLQEWTVDLGAYDNQTVYIAFFHDSNDDNLIMIDDIFIGTTTPFDLSVTSTVTEPYYSTPITQVSSRSFTSTLELEEDQSVTNPTAEFEIFQGPTSVFTDSQSAPSLAPGATLTLTSTNYTPNAIGQYTAVITASATEVDPFPLNNIDSVMFAVSDSTFATENGVITGSLGIGAGSAGVLGNEYVIQATDDLTSITFTLNNPVIGDTVVGVIYDMVGGVPNQVIGMTDTLFVTASTPAEYTLHVDGGSISLASGSYIVGLKESISNNVTLATNTEFYTPLLSWVFFNGTWSNNENFGFLNTYLLRANFGEVCDEALASYSETINDLFVSFTDASANTDSWAWDFGDGNTSTMQNPSHTYAMAGTYTVCLIAMNNCSADTMCTTVTVDVSGIEENNLIDNLQIYPIPSNGKLTIANLPLEEDLQIVLINNVGQIVQTTQTNGQGTIELNLNDIFDGYYHLQFSGTTAVGARSLIIKH